ncbi:MAG: aminoglycoside phosphotransferase family protein [Candidatus Aenigmarchaeota archaeon]|nr:aminoglycoside phosphotransferase family protein [Candidatus Aenigmarchaeota archaeon]
MEIALSSIQKAVRKEFPQATLDGYEKINKGQINEVYRLDIKNIDTPLLLRKYSTNDYWKAKKEVNVYRTLAKQGKVPVPEIFIQDRKRNALPFPYLLMSELPGKDLQETFDSADNDTKELLMERTGECLGKMHQIKYPAFGWIIDSVENWGEVIKRDLGWSIIENIFETNMPKKLIYRTLDYMYENMNLLEIKEKPVLVHNDFTMDNIKVQDNLISGVFDFEHALSGHNEYDFIKPDWLMFTNKKLKERFMSGYKKNSDVSSKFEERLKYYETQRAVGMYMWFYKNGNKEEAQKKLDVLKSNIGFD